MIKFPPIFSCIIYIMSPTTSTVFCPSSFVINFFSIKSVISYLHRYEQQQTITIFHSISPLLYANFFDVKYFYSIDVKRLHLHQISKKAAKLLWASFSPFLFLSLSYLRRLFAKGACIFLIYPHFALRFFIDYS